MKKPKIKVIITKEITGYSASAILSGNFIGTEGESYDELKLNILESINFTFKEEGFIYSIEEIIFTLDLQSFFDFYKVLNAKALSERIGMNQSLLAQYISGKKKPSANQTQRILEGVRQIGRELAEIRFFI
jgi:transcriptional regulator with XRE-family HTH domain